MNYTELLKKLFEINMTGGIKLGLSNCLRLNAALNFPDRNFNSIHVAGTNGKGSVTKKIAKTLENVGYKVGQYTSPHISCFRERISINGQMISEKSVEKHLSEVFEVAESEDINATFFEYTTLLALSYFSKEKVDFVVLETGLGGRLDATNIVKPKLTIITSISLEHVEILGDSLEAITREKAGIIKSGVPVVLGPRVPIHIIHEVSENLCCPCIQVEGSFLNYEAENCAIAKTALAMMSIPEEAIQKGLTASMPCRLEKWHDEHGRCRIILDVAHNPDGLAHLFQAIRQFTSLPLRVICGLSKTKDLEGCLKIIKQNAAYIHLVEAPNGRGASVEFLHKLLVQLGLNEDNLTIKGSISDNVEYALKQTEFIIICGTFFIMSEVRAALGISEPRDLQDMNERKTT